MTTDRTSDAPLAARSASREKLHAILAGLNEAVFAFLGNGDLVFHNRSAAHMIDLDPDAEGDAVRAALLARDFRTDEGEPLAEDEHPLARLLAGETFRDRELVEFAVPRPAGTGASDREERVWLCSAMLLQDGDLLHVLTFRDVRDRRRVERAEAGQERAEERFDVLFSLNPAPTLLVDLDDRTVLGANDGVRELTGHGVDALRGRSVDDASLFHDVATFRRALERLAAGEAIPKTEAALRTADGELAYVIFAAKPLPESGAARAVMTFLDVTEERHAQIRFDRAFRLAPIPALMVGLEDGRVLDLNEAFEHAFGLERNEVRERPLVELELWASLEDARASADALAEEGRYRHLEMTLRGAGDATLDVLGYAEVIDIEGDRVALHMFSDISERKRTESMLKELVREVMADASLFAESVVGKVGRLQRAQQPDAAPSANLTRRERQVLELLARGMENEHIGAELGVAPQTVRNYVSGLYDKLGVSSRSEAVVWARERGMGLLT